MMYLESKEGEIKMTNFLIGLATMYFTINIIVLVLILIREREFYGNWKMWKIVTMFFLGIWALLVDYFDTP